MTQDCGIVMLKHDEHEMHHRCSWDFVADVSQCLWCLTCLMLLKRLFLFLVMKKREHDVTVRMGFVAN